MEVKITDTFIDRLLKNLKESEFEELGFSKNPFIPFIPKEIMGTFVNREEEKRLLIRYLPEMIFGAMPLLVLAGSKGIGKTHFLNYIYEELKNAESELEHEIELLEVEDFELFYNEVKTESKITQKLVLLDDTEKIWETNKEKLVNLIDSYPNIKLICVWNYSKWQQTKNDPFYSSLKPVCIKMNELTEDHLVKIVMIRMASVILKEGSYPFDEKSLYHLASLARGVPYSMVYFCEKALHYALDHSKSSIDEKLILEFIDSLKLKQFNFAKISKSQWNVLKALVSITNSKKRGATSSEIADEIGLSRPAVIAQVKELVNQNFIEEKMDNKRKLYYIKPVFQGKIENYISEEEEL